MFLFLALVLVPIIEIALFIEMGQWIGTWPTVGIVVATAFLGTVLLRAQGFAAIARLQQRLAEGEDPSDTLAHGALILVSGIVLVTPGFFTDAIGFLLLVPAVRRMVIRSLARRFAHAVITRVELSRAGQAHDPRSDPRGTVETSWEEVDETETDAPRGTGPASGWEKPPAAGPDTLRP